MFSKVLNFIRLVAIFAAVWVGFVLAGVVIGRWIQPDSPGNDLNGLMAILCGFGGLLIGLPFASVALAFALKNEP
jgi:hypothetical protein